MVKKLTLGILILIISLNFMSVSSAESFLKIVVDGNTVEFEGAKPYVEITSSRVMVPIRFVAEALGAEVIWNPKEREVCINKNNQTIVLNIEESWVKINGEMNYLDTAPKVTDGRVFVPVRFVAEFLGSSVEWNDEEKTVNIKSGNVQAVKVAQATQAVSQSVITQEEQTLLNLVNKARKDAGLKPLAFDINLVKTARLKAKDMVLKGYFSHNSPTYGSPFDMLSRYGIKYMAAGENIALNSSVESAFKAWMNSEGHRENILNGDYNFTGIGIETKPNGSKILVQQFIGK